jgi:hypothetical protein
MKKLVIRTATVNDASLQAPLPPPKRSGKRLTALLVITIAIVAAVVGASLIMRGSSPSSNNSTPLPGATSTPLPGAVGTASSLKFSYIITSEGPSAGTHTFIAKNIGESNLMIWEEYATSSDDTIEIVNGVQQKYWTNVGFGQWSDLSSLYSTGSELWNNQLVYNINILKSWSGVGDYTYNDVPNGRSIRYFNIAVNPTLADSLFQP